MNRKCSSATTLYGEIGEIYSASGDAKVQSTLRGSVGMRLRWQAGGPGGPGLGSNTPPAAARAGRPSEAIARPEPMDLSRTRLPVSLGRIVAPLLLAVAASGAPAQQDAERFPAAAMSFLGGELPAMEAAIAARDRDYFEDAMGRMLDFSDSWGFKTRDNPALARFPMCTDAVSDFLVVGMCRIMTTNAACEPGMAARFNSNLQKCRELAAKL